MGKTRHIKFGVRLDIHEYESTRDRLLPNKMRSGSRHLFKFWEITANISETVQGKDIDTTYGGLRGKRMCAIEYGTNNSDLE